MEKPLVTIVIPVYNGERYVKKCLESVLNQSYENLEIIVIDDGSEDRSAQLVEQMTESDGRVLFIKQENRGVSAVRNRGAEMAKGKYLTFLDGDDYIGKTYIENFVIAAESAQAQLCVCGYTMVDETGKKLLQCAPAGPYIRGAREEYPYRILATLSRFYLTGMWRRHRIFFEENKQIRGEDIPVALLTNAAAANICCVSQTDYYYVQHEKSARSGMKGLAAYQLPYQALEACIRYVREIPKKNAWDFFELGVFRVLVTFLFDLGRGATKESLEEIYRFERKIIGQYFPDYRRNKKMRLFSGLDIPFGQKLAVKVYVVLLRCGLLYSFACMVRKCG